MATEQNIDIEPMKAQVFQKISELERLILTNDPLIAGHLAAIHKNLIQYDELTHLLSDEQIREIIKAQIQATGTVLIQKTTKTSSASLMKQARAITVDDL